MRVPQEFLAAAETELLLRYECKGVCKVEAARKLAGLPKTDEPPPKPPRPAPNPAEEQPRPAAEEPGFLPEAPGEF